jgi:arylsulfatase A-like enzyme
VHRVTFVLLLLLSACAPRPRQPTVVLITLDTVRADHLSTYDYPRETDPFLRELAAESRVFEAAIAPATWTLPSHATLFTGLDPAEHGAYMRADPEGESEMLFPALPTSIPTLASRLRDAGYHLVGAAGGPFASEHHGFAREFDAFLSPLDEALSSAELNEFVSQELARRPADRPLFLFVNYFDAHAPYAAPGDREYPFPLDDEGRPVALEPAPGLVGAISEGQAPDAALVQRALDQYDREIWVQDGALRELWERLHAEGLLDDALAIVTADHGELFGEFGQFGHGGPPLEPVARVPLVVHRAPDGPADRIDAPVSLRSVPGTILRHLDLPALPRAGAGEPLDLLGSELEGSLPYTEFRDPKGWVGVVRGPRYKYARTLAQPFGEPGGATLVDLVLDPEERGTPVETAEAREAATRLSEALDALLAAWRPEPGPPEVPSLTPAQRAMLEALGYGR